MDSAQCIRTLSGHRSTVLCLKLLKKQGQLISGSADKTLRIWNINTGECLRMVTGHTLSIKSLFVKGSAVASGSQDNTIKIWNLKEKCKCVRTITGHDSFVNCVAFNSRMIVSGSSDKTIRIMKF